MTASIGPLYVGYYFTNIPGNRYKGDNKSLHRTKNKTHEILKYDIHLLI